MKRQEQWRKVLDTEMQRWSALPYDELVSRLDKALTYEVEMDSRKYHVEIEILENTAEYVHACIGVDDGSLPASIVPTTDSFITKKSETDV